MGYPKYLQVKDPQNAGVGHTLIPQLCQLLQLTWDGDLISKQDRTELVKRGLATGAAGYNIITPEGIQVMTQLDLLKP